MKTKGASAGGGNEGERDVERRTSNVERLTPNERPDDGAQHGSGMQGQDDRSGKRGDGPQEDPGFGGGRQPADGTKQTGEPQRIYDMGERLLEFSARIIRLVDSLPNTRSANHVGGQVLRSGTSPLSNHGEAQAAESIADFIHKLMICLKELNETFRWLRLIARVPLVKRAEKVGPLIQESDELCRIFAKSLQTARARQKAQESNRLREQAGDEEADPWICDPWLTAVSGLSDSGTLRSGCEKPFDSVSYERRGL